MRLFTLIAIAAFSASVLAGCSGSNDTTTTTTQPPPVENLDPGFGPAVEVGQGSEPGLLLTNGTIWAHAPGHMWRSANGTSWNEVNPGPALGVFGNDAEMVQDAEGTLYYSDLQLTASLAMYTSTDDGATWTYHPNAGLVPAVDRQWMATGPDAGPLAGAHSATYLAFNHLGSSPWFTKSTDGGQTWVGHVIDPTQPQATFWSMGNLVVDPKDGALFVSWTVGYAAEGVGPNPPVVDYKIRFATSTDGGLTWTAHDLQDTAGNPGNLLPIMAQDDGGELYVTWSEAKGDHNEILLSSSGDRGATWSAPIKINAGNGTAVMPWVDAGKAGDIAVVWYGNNVTKLAAQASGDWFVYMAQSMDANGTAPTFRQVQVTPEAIRTDAICTVGIACTGDRELADFFEVRLDGAGLANIIYADTEHGSGTTSYFIRQVDGPTL